MTPELAETSATVPSAARRPWCSIATRSQNPINVIQEVTADQHRRSRLLGNRDQMAENIFTTGRIEADRGLIEKQNTGPVDQCSGDPEALAHAAAERSDLLV